MRLISALASDPPEARRIRRKAITPCTSAAKRPASIKLRQKSSMHTSSNEVKKNPAQRAPGSCCGRRIALCRAFSFGCLPERALASDKTLDDEKVPGAPMVAANARPSRFGLTSSDPRGNPQFEGTMRKQGCSILYSVQNNTLGETCTGRATRSRAKKPPIWSRFGPQSGDACGISTTLPNPCPSALLTL
jgi:hypothetical protein